MKDKLQRELMKCGVSPDLKGFEYIIEAAMIVSEDRDAVMQGVYHDIAKKRGKTGVSVERSIRHAVQQADVSYLEMKKKTNKSFIYALLLKINQEERM